MARYRLRTASGQQYVWEGELGGVLFDVSEADAEGRDGFFFLACPGGTVVNLAHVEAFEPIE